MDLFSAALGIWLREEPNWPLGFREHLTEAGVEARSRIRAKFRPHGTNSVPPFVLLIS